MTVGRGEDAASVEGSRGRLMAKVIIIVLIVVIVIAMMIYLNI